jgi:hypothetical protein
MSFELGDKSWKRTLPPMKVKSQGVADSRPP